MNNFFINAVANLNIEEPFLDNVPKDGIKIGAAKAFEKFEKHPSILKIKEIYQVNETFCFNETTINDIKFEIDRLNTNITTACNDLAANIITKSRDIVSPYLKNVCKSQHDILINYIFIKKRVYMFASCNILPIIRMSPAI